MNAERYRREIVQTRRSPSTRVLGVLLLTTIVSAGGAQADDDRHGHDHDHEYEHDVNPVRVQRGFDISPVELDLGDRNEVLVGLGSYIVNAQGACNDCHTNPPFAPGGNPFLGEPEQINAAQYLSGGTIFGPFVSANITPDEEGKPAGLSRREFRRLLRTGHDPDDPDDELLQVMPWPVYGKMTNRDLNAIYVYLQSIPSLPDNPSPDVSQ